VLLGHLAAEQNRMMDQHRLVASYIQHALHNYKEFEQQYFDWDLKLGLLAVEVVDAASDGQYVSFALPNGGSEMRALLLRSLQTHIPLRIDHVALPWQGHWIPNQSYIDWTNNSAVKSTQPKVHLQTKCIHHS
jgi:hypothetical protein